MKRIAPLIVIALLVCTMPGVALAAEPPGPETAEQATSTVYPTEVIESTEGEAHRLSKVYLLTAADDPATIPTANFVREGISYTLLDMTRTDQTATDTKLHTETVTVESKSKDMDKILPLLTTTREVTTEDGYTGVLTLDTASIKVEAAGYGSSSRTVTAKRSYPNLSDADTALVPKTTEDSGRTLELADVQWQEAGGFYHATATYTGTATSKYATGYTVTAGYAGEVSKTTSDTVKYTAIFGGTPIQPPAAEAVPFDWNALKWLALPIGAGVVILAVVLIRRVKSRKERYRI